MPGRWKEGSNKNPCLINPFALRIKHNIFGSKFQRTKSEDWSGCAKQEAMLLSKLSKAAQKSVFASLQQYAELPLQVMTYNIRLQASLSRQALLKTRLISLNSPTRHLTSFLLLFLLFLVHTAPPCLRQPPSLLRPPRPPPLRLQPEMGQGQTSQRSLSHWRRPQTH